MSIKIIETQEEKKDKSKSADDEEEDDDWMQEMSPRFLSAMINETTPKEK